jgi:hypothetical protein
MNSCSRLEASCSFTRQEVTEASHFASGVMKVVSVPSLMFGFAAYKPELNFMLSAVLEVKTQHFAA